MGVCKRGKSERPSRCFFSFERETEVEVEGKKKERGINVFDRVFFSFSSQRFFLSVSPRFSFSQASIHNLTSDNGPEPHARPLPEPDVTGDSRRGRDERGGAGRRGGRANGLNRPVAVDCRLFFFCL